MMYSHEVDQIVVSNHTQADVSYLSLMSLFYMAVVPALLCFV